MGRNKQIFEEAQRYIPGGVNSPVRAFKAVGGAPPILKSAQGAYLLDEEDKQYIDYIGSWGPMILGHAHPQVVKAISEQAKKSSSYGASSKLELDVAKEIISRVPSIEKVRMLNSGTEATMSAIRLARAYTKRTKIIKFEGCYHGHADLFLSQAGSGLSTLGIPNCPGVPEETTASMLTLPYNNIEAVEEAIKQYPEEIAAIILEPVAGNMGCIAPATNYLQELRAICSREGIVLVFDEVMTGFRVSRGGAQELYGVLPDLTCLGKVIGGGLPVGAFGGKSEIMDMLAPLGPVYQAGTLSGNPLAMCAGLTTLNLLNEEVYAKLEIASKSVETGLHEIMKSTGIEYTINRVGSMITLFLGVSQVRNFDEAKKADNQYFKDFFRGMLKQGIYLPPSSYESWFVSTAHGEKEIAKTIEAARSTMFES